LEERIANKKKHRGNVIEQARQENLERIMEAYSQHYQRMTNRRNNRPKPQFYNVKVELTNKNVFKNQLERYLETGHFDNKETIPMHFQFTCFPNELEEEIDKRVHQQYFIYDFGEAMDFSSRWGFFEEYHYSVLEDHDQIHAYDVYMKRAKPLKVSFLKYFENIHSMSYEESNDECVPTTLMKYFQFKKEKTVLDVFHQASLDLYQKEWNRKDGVSSRMLLYFCKAKNITLLGFNQFEQNFIKYNKSEKGSNKYPAIIYYQVIGHFYIITDVNIIRSITSTFREGFSVSSSMVSNQERKPEGNKFFEASNLFASIYEDENNTGDKVFEKEFEILEKLTKNDVVLYPNKLNDRLRYYIEKFSMIPKYKHATLFNIGKIQLRNGATMAVKDTLIETEYAKSLCAKLDIVYLNQSFGS